MRRSVKLIGFCIISNPESKRAPITIETTGRLLKACLYNSRETDAAFPQQHAHSCCYSG